MSIPIQSIFCFSAPKLGVCIIFLIISFLKPFSILARDDVAEATNIHQDSLTAEQKWPIMMGLMNRIRGEYNVSYQAYAFPVNQVDLTLLGNKQSYYSTSIQNNFGVSLSVSYGFYVTDHLYVIYGINSRFGKTVLNKNNQFALGYNGIIKGKSRNWYLEPYISYYFSKNGYSLGEYSGNSGEKFGNVPLRPNKSLLFVGQKQQGISLGLGVRADLYSFLSVMVGVAYYGELRNKQGLFNANKHIFYTRTGFQEFNNEMLYQEDGVFLNKTSFQLNPWQFKLGFMFAL